MNNTSIQSNSTVCRKVNLEFTQVDDELLSIDEKAGYCYSFNNTAGRIWELISQPITVESLCERLCEEFAIDQTSCLKDTAQLLRHLHKAGLIEIKNPA